MGFRKLADKPIFSYRVVSMAPSWSCDADCRHCFIPLKNRRKDDFNAEALEGALRSLPAGVRVVAFTGGEPFLHPQRFYRLLGAVSDAGRVATVVTNALWSVDWNRGEPLLMGAWQNGLRCLSVSVDDYHRPSPAVGAIVRLLKRARELGMVVNVRGIGKRARRKIASVRESGVFSGQESAETVLDLDNVGEAATLERDRVQKRKQGGCLGALEPLVTPRGEVCACCSTRLFKIENPVLMLGNVTEKPLDELLGRSSRDYLMAALIAWGPRGLLRLLGKKCRPEPGLSGCELCLAVLNDPAKVDGLLSRIAEDKHLRKDIVGWHMIFEACYRPGLLPEVEAFLGLQ